MAHKIFVNFDNIEFEIPTPKRDKTLIISVPPIDCLAPNDVDKINAQLDELNTSDIPDARKPENNAHVMVLVMLKFYNPKSTHAAIDALLPAEISQINDIWGKESAMSMGESEASTDESSATGD